MQPMLPRSCMYYGFLTVLFLSLSFFSSNAQASDQNDHPVTLAGTSIPLRAIFKAIKQQTGFAVMYNTTLTMLNQEEKVTVNFKDTPLDDVLSFLFKGKNLGWTYNDDVLVIHKKEAASKKNEVDSAVIPPLLTGKVTDAAGGPVPGATVQVKGTNQGTTTDADGKFALPKVGNGAMLVISSIGYEKREVVVKGRSVLAQLNVDVNKLDETVVIAYGTTTQRLSTGNVASVKAKDIEKQPVNNPLLALQGRVPGLFITQANGLAGGGVTVRIQGQNSIDNGNTPLYVIDGVPFPTQLGPRIDLGPLGGSGEFENGGPTGSGNALSFINPADIESIDILKDADATAIYGSRAANGAILITTKKGKAGKTKLDINLQQGWSQVSRKMELLNTQQYLKMRHEAYKNDGTTPSLNGFPAAYDLLLWDTTRYTDWQKTLIGGTAQYTNINAGISGGTQAVQYLMGGTFHRETTVFPGHFSDQKGSVHLNLNNTSNNQKFHFNVSASYLVDNNQLPQTDLTNKIFLEPNAPALYKADGTLNWEPTASGTSSWTNPLATAFYSTYQAKTNNLFTSANMSYRILPGLEFSDSMGYTNIQSNTYQLNSLLAIAPESRPINNRNAFYGTNNVNTWIIEPQVTYKRNLGKGKLDLLLGSTFQQTASNGGIVWGSGYINDLVLKDMGSALSLTPFGGTFDNLYKYNALFGRLNYNWQDKYIINLSARRDGSSRFGDKNKFHNFGGIGVAWIFTQEAFIQRALPFLSFGKLRGSYGTTGSDRIGDYRFLNLYSRVYAEVPYQGMLGISPDGLNNPYLQWEETRKWQMGLDLGFMHDQILLNVGYARNRCSNQLLAYTLPAITGSTSIFKNFPATVQNTSWEFALNTTNIKNRDFTWTSNINLTIPQNKLVAFPDLASSTYALLFATGKDINTKRVLHFMGVDPTTGVYRVASKTDPSNPIYPDDYNIFVNTSPKFHGGFQNSFHYKGFQLDVLFQFVKQQGVNNIFNNGYTPPGVFFGNGTGNQPVGILNRWQQPGDIKAIQKYSAGFSLFGPLGMAMSSDEPFKDASYIHLKNLSLSWELPTGWKQKARLQNSRIFLQCQNLLTITRYKGLDPENQNSASLPPLRVITLGLQVSL